MDSRCAQCLNDRESRLELPNVKTSRKVSRPCFTTGALLTSRFSVREDRSDSKCLESRKLLHKILCSGAESAFNNGFSISLSTWFFQVSHPTTDQSLPRVPCTGTHPGRSDDYDFSSRRFFATIMASTTIS